MRILHVSESFGGGVETAIRNFGLLRDHRISELRLLAASRDGVNNQREPLAGFDNVSWTDSSPLSFIRAIRNAVREMKPDVVHLHSSWAGLFGRVALRPRAIRIVYSPHGFSFERMDVAPIFRRLFWLVESMLSKRTAVIATCSRRETELAQKLSGDPRVVFLPNFTSVVASPRPPKTSGGSIVCVGRATAAKDPHFFTQVIAELRTQFRETPEVWWIGPAEPQYAEALCRGGVQVTGWLSPEEVQARIEKAAVYLHTSLWEGFPLTILEASAHGIPIVARARPYLQPYGPKWMAAEPKHLAEQIVELLQSEDSRSRNVEDWRAVLHEHREESTVRALVNAYASVSP